MIYTHITAHACYLLCRLPADKPLNPAPIIIQSYTGEDDMIAFLKLHQQKNIIYKQEITP